jgi:Arc/MetJ-type ribon-helix-helix transcriptional regulator
MTLTVRLPLRVEQQLAEYCVTRKVSKSEVVKEALGALLAQTRSAPAAYALGKDLFNADDTSEKQHIAYSKENLRAIVRSRGHRR